ncbi:MAG: hypothetical protein JKY99_09235 [Rhizobiales bacterium]|nr:hypothetical protein [Hyphomicrobiales bacterium]
MLMDAFSLNVKMIPGYKGNEAEMAMLRGEVVGQIGSLSALSPFVETGNGMIAVYLGGKLQPQAIEFAKSDKAKSIVNLITAMSGLGRLTAAPGGVPAPVLKELRDGYMAVMQSADFLAEAKKLGLPIDAANGEDVTRLVRAALQQSPETVKIIAEALDIEIPSITANSEILSLEDKNKVIEFNSGDVVVKAKISGSRTKITIDGADADRKALNVGMSCEIIYDPNHEKFEPSVMDCSS